MLEPTLQNYLNPGCHFMIAAIRRSAFAGVNAYSYSKTSKDCIVLAHQSQVKCMSGKTKLSKLNHEYKMPVRNLRKGPQW